MHAWAEDFALPAQRVGVACERERIGIQFDHRVDASGLIERGDARE